MTRKTEKDSTPDRIVAYALTQGVTLDEIVLHCGVAATTVQSWRRGDRPMRAIYRNIIQQLIDARKTAPTRLYDEIYDDD